MFCLNVINGSLNERAKLVRNLHVCKNCPTFAKLYTFGMAILTQKEIKLYSSLRLKKYRDETGLFVAEGDKCINELLPSFDLVRTITTEKDGEQAVKHISQLQTPQGSIAVFKQKKYAKTEIDGTRLLLALDGIQDPGNLGTIIRTADWFGIDDILCSDKTADCYSPKVVQATMGALARVRIHYTADLAREILRISKQFDSPIYGTLLDGKNIYEDTSIIRQRNGIVIMGNEGNGISAEVRQTITHSLYIPAYKTPTVESLNVGIATAVVLSEIRRRQNA